MKRTTTLAVVAGLLWFASPAVLIQADKPATSQEAVSYYRDIRPILAARCVGCHQPAKASGSLVLTSAQALARPGDSELPGVVAGKPDESYLPEQVPPLDGVAAMPPEEAPLEAS